MRILCGTVQQEREQEGEREKRKHEKGERTNKKGKGEQKRKKKVTSCGNHSILFVIKYYFSFSGLKLFVFFKVFTQRTEVM
jgi:hypothetical protein